MQCPKCHTDNSPQAKFCTECGQKLEGQPAPPVGVEERRLATVLFSDLVGYTSLAENMDPEEVHNLLNRIFSRFREVIEENGGYVDRYIGDALIAVFGVPQAQEDDPERAVRVALRLKEELKKISDEIKRQLSIRVGVNTGEVLWGGVAGAESTVLGDTVNIAQRLQVSASINSILISQSTQRHLKKGFRLRQIPTLKLEGKDKVVQAFEVLGVEEVKLPRAAPFVGRESQLGLVTKAFDQMMREKQPAFVMIYGEAGIGKSRLLQEFKDNILKLPHQIRFFSERCLPHAQLPYDPLAEIIRHYFDLTELSLADAKIRVQKESARLFPDDPLAHHFFGFFLGMKYADSPLDELDSASARSAAFNVVRKLLEKSAEEVGAIVILVEDLQWADVGTADFLEYFSSAQFTGPLMIIGTARPQEGISDFLSKLRQLPSGECPWKLLELMPFGKEVTNGFVDTLLKNTRLPVELREELWIKTGGNPLFLEELIRGLSEEMELSKISYEQARVKLPENVWQIIESRLDRLPENEKKAIKTASVFGRIFWQQGLEQCLKRQAKEELLSLEARGFIFRSPESLYKNDYEYNFRHELLRDVAYRMLLKRERVELHQTVLEFMSTKQKNQELGLELYLKLGSHHAEESRDFNKALDMYETYGDYESNRYMVAEAIRVYQRAQELIDNADLKDPKERQAQLIEKEARLHFLLSDYKKASEGYERLRNQPPHWSWRVRGLLGEAAIHQKRAEYENAFRFAGEASEISFHGKNNRLLGQSLNLVAVSLIGQGLYAGATKLAQRVRNSFAKLLQDKSLDEKVLIDVKKELATSFNNIAQVQFYQGEHAQALQVYQDSLKLMQGIGNRYGIAASHINIGNVYRDQGDYQAALENYKESFNISQAIGSRRGMAIALLNMGGVRHDEGDYNHALEYFQQSLQISREIDAKREQTTALTGIGNLYHDQGDYGLALKTHQEGLQLKRELADSESFRSDLVTTLLNLGTLYFERGDYSDATELIGEAENIAGEVKAKMELVASFNTLGRILVFFALMGGLPDVRTDQLFAKARTYGERAFKMSKSLNLKPQILEAITTMALINIQEASWLSNGTGSTPLPSRPAGGRGEGDITPKELFVQAQRYLADGERLLPQIHRREAEIHYLFTLARYYLEYVNTLSGTGNGNGNTPGVSPRGLDGPAGRGGTIKDIESTRREISRATKRAVEVASRVLNITQDLGIKRLQPEAMFLYVQALSLTGEKSKAANYYDDCRRLAEMMGLKPFLRMTAQTLV